MIGFVVFGKTGGEKMNMLTCPLGHRILTVMCIAMLATAVGGRTVSVRAPEGRRSEKALLARPGLSLTGLWSSEAGDFELTQTDSQIIGSFSDGTVLVEGTFGDGQLSAMWLDKETGKIGRLRAYISAGGDTLRGLRTELKGKREIEIRSLTLVRK